MMNSKNKHLLKKLNNEELKDVNGGFYVCIINNNIEDAIVLAENHFEDRVIKALGEEQGESAVYIADYLYRRGCEEHVLHLREWTEVECIIEILRQINMNQVNA